MGTQKIWLMSGRRFDSAPKLVAILPVGSVERHGDHLPLGTDTLEAETVASMVSEKMGAHLFPPVWYGSSLSLRRFGGTIDVEPNSLHSYVKSIIREILRNGYLLVVVINGHGGNSYILREVAREVASEFRERAIMVIDWWKDVGQKVRETLFESPGHAGEDETSVMMSIAPDYVDMDSAKDHTHEMRVRVSTFSTIIDEAMYPEAVLGKATKASPEKGRQFLEAVAEEIASEIQKTLQVLSKPSEP